MDRVGPYDGAMDHLAANQILEVQGIEAGLWNSALDIVREVNKEEQILTAQ